MLARARLWLRSIALRGRLERDMQEEIDAHLERSTQRLMARGLSADDARLQARREFGNVPLIHEDGRDARGARWIDGLAGDVRFAWRHFARTPLVTLTMLAVLSVGISLSTLLFSTVQALAIEPPSGLACSDDLVRIRGVRGREGDRMRGLDADEMREYRSLDTQFTDVAWWTGGRLPLVVPSSDERRPIDASVTYTSPNYFSLLGARPTLGRGFDASDASAQVAVIAHSTWAHVFAEDPGIVGRTILLRGQAFTVIGVAPERFYGPSEAYNRVHVWLPVDVQRSVAPFEGKLFSAAARLAPGATVASATAAVRVVGEQATATNDSLRADFATADVSALLAMNGDPGFEKSIVKVSLLVATLALLILLVTCTNVSALLMGLATARRQEIAVRLSLGAGRARLLRQLLTESVLLATTAGVAALGMVTLALRAAMYWIVETPLQLRVTPEAAGFTFTIALLVGVIFGLVPALHGTRVALAGALRDSAGAVSGGRGRLQRGLVVAQVAFTMPLIVLLTTVLLVVLSELRPRRETERGDQLLSVRLRPPVSMAPDASAEAARAWETLRAPMQRLTARFDSTPGVSATIVDWGNAKDLGAYVVHSADRAGGADDAIRLSGEWAASGYFDLIGIRVLRGRGFEPSEVVRYAMHPPQAPIVIGADVARRLWPDADAIGRRLVLASDTAHSVRTLTVVGVIDDPLAGARKPGATIRVYVPPDTTWQPRALLIQTSGSATSLLPAALAAVNDEASGFVSDVQTLAEIQDAAFRIRRLVASGVSTAGAMALLLSAVGLYAVVAFAVARRTREIAVRMAVGATGGRIVRLFVSDGLRLGVIGLVIGLPIGMFGLNMLMALDSDLPAPPPGAVTLIASLGIVVTALVAAWLPARRAAAVDAAVTLRAE